MDNKKGTEKDGSGCFMIFLVFIFLMVLIFAVSASEKQDEQNEYSSALSSLAGASNQDKFEYAAKYVYGNDLIEAYAINEYPTVNVKSSGTAEYIRSRSCSNALSMLERISEIKAMHGFEFKEIQFRVHTGLVDVYGNKSEGLVLSFGITAEALDRINFENMLSSNIQKIAINWYEHPAMK